MMQLELQLISVIILFIFNNNNKIYFNHQNFINLDFFEIFYKSHRFTHIQ
ncbi:unnamed protein product [Paramecium sonneborni]|uniref:Uncharacterized protein n=1 Tax=Paramecium sonneborni TaxID=65129 RepID=A0A8S1MDT3_9CILI|nr:unnamed protein product [Paramecium sonneborni]